MPAQAAHPLIQPSLRNKPPGDVAALVAPQTRNVTASVRAAATACLGAILLQPDVHGALATTPGERAR